jgi:polysaccharide biosynthesis protein PslG
MKRTVQLLLLLSMTVALLAACGGDAGPVVEPEDQVPTPLPLAPVEETEEVEVEEATLPPPVVDTEPTPTLAPGAPGGEPEEPAAAPEQPAVEETGAVFPWPEDHFGYGVQIHGNATVGDPVATMDAVANQLGMDWIKVQLKWPVVHPSPDVGQWFFYDGVLDEAERAGLNVMLSVVGAPEWTRALGGENGPPDDYDQYYEFLEELLARYDGKVHAIEVWNEQNLDREWMTSEGLVPASYVEFLRGSYETIKAHDPNIIVISGALSPTGFHDAVTSYDDFIYLDGLLAAGMLDYADCVGVHHNGYNVPPSAGVEDLLSLPEAQTATFRGPFGPPFDAQGNPHHSWSFRTTLEGYAEKAQALDPDARLCVTEFGWASSEGYERPPDGFGFAADNTLEEQAENIVAAFQQMRESGDVWLAFLFNFDFGNKGSGILDDPVPYSIIDINGVPRPAYGALAAMEKQP